MFTIYFPSFTMKTNVVYILEKPNLTRTKFASFTSSEPTLGLGLKVQYIFNTPPQTHGAV